MVFVVLADVPGSVWKSLNFSATLVNSVADVDNIVDEVFDITSHMVWDEMFCGSLGNFWFCLLFVLWYVVRDL